MHIQYIKNYAHADFIMGFNAKDIVYNQIKNYAHADFIIYCAKANTMESYLPIKCQ